MRPKTARIAAAAAITGALVFGGYGLASAQEEDPTTTTVQEDESTTPSTEEGTTEDRSGDDCPHGQTDGSTEEDATTGS